LDVIAELPVAIALSDLGFKHCHVIQGMLHKEFFLAIGFYLSHQAQ